MLPPTLAASPDDDDVAAEAITRFRQPCKVKAANIGGTATTLIFIQPAGWFADDTLCLISAVSTKVMVPLSSCSDRGSYGTASRFRISVLIAPFRDRKAGHQSADDKFARRLISSAHRQGPHGINSSFITFRYSLLFSFFKTRQACFYLFDLTALSPDVPAPALSQSTRRASSMKLRRDLFCSTEEEVVTFSRRYLHRSIPHYRGRG